MAIFNSELLNYQRVSVDRGTHGLNRMQQKREVWASWWVIYICPAVYVWALLTEKI